MTIVTLVLASCGGPSTGTVSSGLPASGINADSDRGSRNTLEIGPGEMDSLTSGYPLSHSPDSVLGSLESNQLVFVASVLSIGETKRIEHQPGVTGRSIPIQVRVEEVLKGAISVGDVVEIRHLPRPGERVGGPAYEDMSPPITTYVVGRMLLLLTQEAVDIGDGPATTPNHVFVVEPDRLIEAFDDEEVALDFLEEVRSTLRD